MLKDSLIGEAEKCHPYISVTIASIDWKVVPCRFMGRLKAAKIGFQREYCVDVTHFGIFKPKRLEEPQKDQLGIVHDKILECHVIMRICDAAIKIRVAHRLDEAVEACPERNRKICAENRQGGNVAIVGLGRWRS